jgi:putative ATP-dependent endonuclease of the OLD family
MRIKRVRIANYRCLNDLEVMFDDITTLIGANGVGKSSVLRALEWFFNGDRAAMPTEDDVTTGAETREIMVEVEFRDLTAEDRIALGRYAPMSSETMVVKRRWAAGTDEITVAGRAWPGFAQIRGAVAAMDKRRRYSELRDTHPDFDLPPVRSVAEVDEALFRWEELHPDQLAVTDVPVTQLFNFAGQAKMSGLFDYVFVSADLRADEEARDIKSSVVGRILEQAVDRRDADQELADLGVYMADQHAEIQGRHFTEQLDQLSARLTGVVGELTRGRRIAVTPIVPEFKPPPIQFAVRIADGPADTRVDQQGHGFRRALLISALRLLAESRGIGSNRVICLAIEEPELFQHPVQARAFATVLRKLATEPARGVQVVYATHSPFFLEPEGFPEIRRVTRRTTADTGFSEVSVRSTSRRSVEQRLTGITKPESVRKQLSGVCLTRLPDAFFANAVIIVEGETDRAVLEGCALREDPLNAHGIAIVEAGSKEGIPLAHAILDDLGIPCFTVFDGDIGAGARAANQGKPQHIADQSAVKANHRIQRYLGIAAEDHPPTRVEKGYAVLQDTLETFLVKEWPEWEKTRKELVKTCRGVVGKNAATYRLAAMEASTPPPGLLTQIIDQAKALSPEGSS